MSGIPKYMISYKAFGMTMLILNTQANQPSSPLEYQAGFLQKGNLLVCPPFYPLLITVACD